MTRAQILRSLFAGKPSQRLIPFQTMQTGSDPILIRVFSRSVPRRADPPQPTDTPFSFGASSAAAAAKKRGAMGDLAVNLSSNPAKDMLRRSANIMDQMTKEAEGKTDEEDDLDDSFEPFHFHIYAHKHNTHVTVTKPNRNAIISMSCGNLGFRKSRRGKYDSAYQLGAYVLNQLSAYKFVDKINHVAVVLRGFGPGREAVTKVLLGTEGEWLRDRITQVADSTRTKHGGTRSPKPRRLG